MCYSPFATEKSVEDLFITKRFCTNTLRYLFQNYRAPLYLKGTVMKLYNNKYIIASTQVTNTKTFAFIAVVVFELLSHKVLFKTEEDNRSC